MKAARRLMRPLVRLMMRSGLTFPVLADALRGLFVEVAVNDILTDPKTRTDSRISLLTGVHRKEIKRLREMPADTADAPDVVTLASQIVARWVGSTAFTDEERHPRPLPRVSHGAADATPSFDALVESVTTDIRPRAVLDDLLSHGVVYMDAEDRVQLNVEAFIPRPGGEEQLFYFARNLHDHVAAAVANISAAGVPPFLDRSVHYDRLTASQAQALDAYARAAAMRVLLDVNRRALELTESTPETGMASQHRINFGVYVFDEDECPAAGAAS
ncbi:MAG: DUF6502 family protein [Rhodopila sp.]|nr:DUF6502 family protein [Rhodopila sp.]